MKTWLLWLMMGMGAGLVVAQPAAPQPAIVQDGFDGPVYQWTPADGLQPLIEANRVVHATPSPDGRWLAYLDPDPVRGAHSESGQFFLLEVATGETIQVTPSENPPPLRGSPVFSPDGSQLFWIEVPSSERRVMQYNIPDDALTILTEYVNLGFQDAGIAIPTLMWGGNGLSYQVGTGGGAVVVQRVGLDGSVGGLGMSFADSLFPGSVAWTQDPDGRDVLLMQDDDTWFTVLSSERVAVQLAQAPLYVPGEGVSAAFANNPDASGGTWAVTVGRDVLTPLVKYAAPWASLPAVTVGDHLLSVTEEGLVHYDLVAGSLGQVRAGEDWRLLGPGGKWVIGGEQTDVYNVNTWSCALPARLPALSVAQVVPGLGANTIRGEPDTEAPQVAAIPAGAPFWVGGGVSCGDGYIWYSVLYNGFEGRTAAGDPAAMQYWIEPSDEPPLVCPSSLPSRVVLEDGSRVRVRTLAEVPAYDRDGQLLATIPAGEVLTLLREPACTADGQTQFQILGHETYRGGTVEADATAYLLEVIESY